MSSSPVLKGVGGQVAGQDFPIGSAPLTIGRSADSTVSITSDGSLSRSHAQVYAQGDAIYVADLGSSNGTKVNGEPVGAPTPLRDGDRIEVGS